MKVELRAITKKFGTLVANDQITLAIAPGTIHGLLGENGAGKSTLMKVLSGFISADGGEIWLDDQLTRFNTPAQALMHGIGMLHQDPLDFPALTVLDNFLLGAQADPQAATPHSLVGLLKPLPRPSARLQLLAALRQFDFDLDPAAPVSRLSPGERQQLELVRLLARGAQVLILDEPTTGISQPQKLKLFATLRRLADDGKTIIFVSHKLEDVEALCQRVTVLRRGQVVGGLERPFNAQTLVRLMFGESAENTANLKTESAVAENAAVRLQLQAVSLSDQRLRMNNLSLSVRAGEVIGFAGVEGSGQQLLMRACGGLHKPLQGQLSVDGVALAGQPYHKFLQQGVAYLPANRMEEGLAPGLNLSEHFELARRSRSITIDWRAAQQWAEAKIAEYNIRGRPTSVVENLSGGNQQRALLALLPTTLKLLLLEHPTRGLDIASAQWVWSQLLERRKHGASIIFTSADLDELLVYADRIFVFSGGQMSAPLNAKTSNIEQIGRLMAEIPTNN